MGKSKKRTFNKNCDKNSIILKRSDIINRIISDIRNNAVNETTEKYIGLFGITSEELTEAGAAYEELSAIRHILFFT